MALYYFFFVFVVVFPVRVAFWFCVGCFFCALLMVISSDLVLAWVGLWSIGAAPAMINHNLVGPPLQHCLKISTAKMVLVSGGEDILSRVNEPRVDVEALGIKIVNLADVRHEIAGLKTSPPGEDLLKNVKQTDPYGLFYTR